MSNIEKLRQDIAFWEEEDRKARETLEITEGLLPDMRRRLAAAEAKLGKEAPEAPSASVPAHAETPPVSTPRFTGECSEQVAQALKWKSPQSSHELRDTLAKYGRAYGLGAIGYALRALKDQGKVQDAGKQGNMKFYKPKLPLVLGSTVNFGDPE